MSETVPACTPPAGVPPATPPAGVPPARRPSIGAITTLAIALVALGFALSIDPPTTSKGFKGDEATYYSLAHSLARDFDFEYRREDLVRVWEELPGPEGIFLKRGRTVDLRRAGRFPFVELAKGPDPDRNRLYFAKSYIYPLFAAPLVWLFGTRGFLVFHALLLALNFGAAYRFLVARRIPEGVAAGYALVFFGASVVPVYFVWLAPELFNMSLAMYAGFFWAYKEAARDEPVGPGRFERFLRSDRSDLAAAVLVGLATFSKPLHVALILPILALAVYRRRWLHGLITGVVFVAVTAALFLGNLAITGDLNYQGGDRKTFYGQPAPGSTYVGPSGFPFTSPRETFETTGLDRTTNEVPVDVLVTGDTFRVFRHNVWYFLVGRYSGLVPYFFPGVLSLVLFLLTKRRRETWQWMVLGMLAATATGLLLYMPYTYSGGGGPIGNRYFMSFYPWFLLLTPSITSLATPVFAGAVGMLFVAKLVFNPFAVSRDPGAAAMSGPLRALPIELTTINDLAVAAHADRSRLPLGGTPPVRAYFPDDRTYNPEGDSFWVRGKSSADVILRAPTRSRADGRAVPLRIEFLEVELTNGRAANRVTVDTGAERQTISLAPRETSRVRLAMPYGVPYKPWQYPTNYTYQIRIRSSAGFVPYFEVPGSTDARYLGVRVRLVPEYVDAVH